MKTAFDVIIKPVLTEKGYSGISEKKYVFIVANKATKFDVKQAVEKVFGVQVDRVNIVNYDGKVQRMGRSEGRQSKFKKAYVFLKEDSKPIEFFDSLS